MNQPRPEVEQPITSGRAYKSDIQFIDDGNESESFFRVNFLYSYKLWKRTFQAFLRRYNRESVVLDEKEVIERLADLEHQQWLSWTEYIAKANQSLKEHSERWAKNWVPYDDLTEEMKEKDRIWARKVYEVCKKQFGRECQKCQDFNGKFINKALENQIKILQRENKEAKGIIHEWMDHSGNYALSVYEESKTWIKNNTRK